VRSCSFVGSRLAVHHVRRSLRWFIYLLASLVGVVAFVYPFFPRIEADAGPVVQAMDSPLFLGLLGGLSLLALLLETQDGVEASGVSGETKRIALLGVLVGLNAVLSFVETAIPGPGGFSPIFFLIILGGYVYGGRFGYLLGALTLFVSALITGGVGPWLPYRMLIAGWIGLAAPLMARINRALRVQGTRWELVVLAVYGGVWGLAFGALMNLWFWPFATGPAEQHWQIGISVWEGVQRFLAFYVATSLLWDLARVAGTAAMMLLFGAPTLRTLRRFARRFYFEVRQCASSLSQGELSA